MDWRKGLKFAASNYNRSGLALLFHAHTPERHFFMLIPDIKGNTHSVPPLGFAVMAWPCFFHFDWHWTKGSGTLFLRANPKSYS
jgi:hypothetical protein